jgi:glycosyltransferase involved in cell wall biosynthesis
MGVAATDHASSLRRQVSPLGCRRFSEGRPALRVLHVVGAADRGGAETVVLRILQHLDPDRVSSSVVTLRAGPVVDELTRVTAMRPQEIQAPRFRHPLRALRTVRRLAAIVRREQPALVHCHGTAAQIYGGAAARRAGVEHVYHVHDMAAPTWSSQGLLERLARANRPALMIAVSEAVAETVDVSRRRVRVVPNGLTITAAERAHAEADAGRVRSMSGWPDDCPLIVWCGRLQRWKGPDVLLRAAARVAAEEPSARFLIVGGELFDLERGFAEALRQLAASLGLRDAVRFTGHQADPLPYLSAADIVVHSSIRPEPFGLVIVEAMALGRPVIAADAGGPREIVVNGVTGLLSPAGNTEALADRMLSLLRDPVQRTALGAAARARAESEFSVERMTADLHAIYDQVAAT